jgi:hypothetical protein
MRVRQTSEIKSGTTRTAAPGFLDSIIIILVSAAIVLFLLWAASRTRQLAVFEQLPDWLKDSYHAVWTSVVSGATGIGLAIVKVFTRKDDDLRPNYLLWIMVVTVIFLILIFLLQNVFSDPAKKHIDTQLAEGGFSPSVSSKDAEARKILSDYAARLHDLDRLVKETDDSTDIEIKGANSILVYRIAYGATEYRTSLPEFQNVPWTTLIRKLEEAGVPDSTTDAIKATDTLMNGPYVGRDTHKRGYFGPGILDTQVNTLQAYYNAAHKHFYGK